jgi:hypothetical protein
MHNKSKLRLNIQDAYFVACKVQTKWQSCLLISPCREINAPCSPHLSWLGIYELRRISFNVCSSFSHAACCIWIILGREVEHKVALGFMKETSHTRVTFDRREEERLETLNSNVFLLLLHISTFSGRCFSLSYCNQSINQSIKSMCFCENVIGS